MVTTALKIIPIVMSVCIALSVLNAVLLVGCNAQNQSVVPAFLYSIDIRKLAIAAKINPVKAPTVCPPESSA